MALMQVYRPGLIYVHVIYIWKQLNLMSSCTDAMSEAINSSFQYSESQKVQTEAEIPGGKGCGSREYIQHQQEVVCTPFCGLYVCL